MAKDDSKDEGKGKLRVIDEEAEPSEEVLRLVQQGKAAEPTPVDRLPIEPLEEMPTRLEAGRTREERRTQEPGVDAILESSGPQGAVESDWGARGRGGAPGWFFLIGVLVVAAIAFAIWGGGEEEAVVETNPRRAAVDHLQEQEQGRAEARELIEAVGERLQEFLAAESVEELLPHIRHPRRVEPLMRDWYRDHPWEPKEFIRIVDFRPFNYLQHSMIKTIVEVKDAEGEVDVIDGFILEEHPDGALKVDWELAVSYQPMPWEEYVKTLPEGESEGFRVSISWPDGGPYSHEFADESVWISFVIECLGSEEFLFGYIRRRTWLESQLHDRFVEAPGQPVDAVVRLTRLPGAESPRGVVISSLVSTTWIRFDEG